MDACTRTGITRRAFATVLLLAAAGTAVQAAAPPDLGGDWQGKLAVDASNSLTVRFTFTRTSNGAYTAVLNSPDNPGVKDTPVSGVSWDGTNLKFAVPTLSGAYAGRLANGRISGEWTQPGGKLPLDLAPWQAQVLSADAARPYEGSWRAELTVPGAKQMLVFNFRRGAKGLEGTFEIPDQGVTAPLTDVMVENGELSLKSMQGRLDYRGRLAGDRINGKLKLPSPVIPPDGVELNLQRGEYKVTPVALNLDAKAFAALKGAWEGEMSITNPANGQKVNLPLVLRFESNAKNEPVGFLDSPAQNARGIVMTDATLADDRVTVRVGTLQAEFTGSLAGAKLTGEWSQAGQRTPLTLTRKP